MCDLGVWGFCGGMYMRVGVGVSRLDGGRCVWRLVWGLVWGYV